LLTARPPKATESSRESRFYEPELDVLRFCAFLAVFLFHLLPSDYASLLPRFGKLVPGLLAAAHNAMSFGVCVFFLLSSYLITKLLILEHERTGSVHIRNFYIRRILRIWPLYLVFLISMWILGKAHVFFPIETGRLIAFLFFAGNIYSGIWGFTWNPILPLWTISIEEQFYLIWPLLARGGRRTLASLAVVILAFSIASTLLLRSRSGQIEHVLWTSSLVQFQFFAFGALLALRFHEEVPRYSLVGRFGLAIAGVALLMVAGGPLHIRSEGQPVSRLLLSLGYEIMAAGTVAIFLAFLGAANGKLSVPRSLTYLGKISFGLYIFHDLSIQVCGFFARRYNLPPGFRALTAALLTLVLAMLSYRYFERPFLTLKNRFTLVPTRPA
jgi:peptidoglycan/LPS O-acetylase OafA/YrhL